ncbi:Ada metal-binding domain-containing protein [Rhizobium alarense]|uniref:Ada metal-binding domain-containing protein n=1 Tax=Rhizobium alarense TaxID=2846851 RepID=UPI002E2EC3AF|nr:Ada metal-binding domain-containing protein [Rhizobium alarense]
MTTDAAAVLPFDEETLWEFMSARDASRAGSFFCAVRTTGIYCRPGCPARLPLRRNVSFHATAQDAEQAGFRACKRCRPGAIR